VCVCVSEQKLYIIYLCDQINHFLIILLITGEGAICVCFTSRYYIVSDGYIRIITIDTTIQGDKAIDIDNIHFLTL